MANYTVVDFNEEKITLSFTQEQLKEFFGDDEDNSEEAKTIYREEIDEAWRMRSVEKELEAKRYSYFRKVISEELREREEESKAERKRSIQEALEQMANELHNYPDSTEEVPLTFTIKELMELFEGNDGGERESEYTDEYGIATNADDLKSRVEKLEIRLDCMMYALHRKKILLEQRKCEVERNAERKAVLKRTIQEALEKKEAGELAKHEEAQKEFDAKQKQLRTEKQIWEFLQEETPKKKQKVLLNAINLTD